MTRQPPPEVATLIADAIGRRVTPGAVVETGGLDGPWWRLAAGRHTYAADAPAVTGDTVYDLASLTKVIATTTLAMDAASAGALPLDTPLRARLTGFGDGPAIAIRDLLEHAGGFPAHRPFYQAVAGRRGVLAGIAATPLTYAPRTRSEYTDLGFILLGALLEDAGGASLSAQFEAFVAEVLGPVDLAFGARDAWRARVAPTSVDAWRGRVLAGYVHDANAAALGGAAGHAGLFGTASAVGAFARWALALWSGASPGWRAATPDTMGYFARRGTVPGSSRALGWDTMLPTSSCGPRMSPRAIGHTGFTGVSLWIDPDRALYAVCLTNRVHPSIDGHPIGPLRVAIHDAILTWADRGAR
ncbi:MAG: serine hydrolase domain-containing protein [Vicinamibacterales bacterium]